MFQRILVVCIGNVCRSPVAAALLRQRFPGRRIESAGLGALVGQDVDPRARRFAERDGLTLDVHAARQLDGDMLKDAELVLVMSEGQRRAIAERDPAVTGKTLLFGRWLAEPEIPDPYHKSESAFAHVHGLMVSAADGWIGKMPER
ncbi:low molecular weight phosphotyrosine protein phosphatase [Salinicola endophyticus]|uniref:protein-tyrosine-phosphatase n=1 Tax=Salinicola endophyticus TaxID=1949083 RepID=A0ABY8FK49_9GAMM|nr:low molecular weight protein-tyrosine-phosphatase [Salinicola endophyticus]WFF43012.1 low molecular weight phosphotyrosine protein phosphatase [Salinicola endophyticus]